MEDRPEDGQRRDTVTEELVRAAAGGDNAAWNALIHRYADRIRAVTLSHRLSEADAVDIAQTTWLRAVERLERLREPERVGAWLATVARRECLQALRSAARQVPTDRLAEVPDDAPSPDATVLEAEQRTLLYRAWSRLTPRDRTLLMLLNRQPALRYDAISERLGIPVGSIGPTRARALQRLRESLEWAERPPAVGPSRSRRIAEFEDRLEEFAADVFASMSRKDQRRWGRAYLRAVLLPDERQCAEAQEPPASGEIDAAPQQFVTQSPWAWQPVRRRIAERVATGMQPKAWFVEDLAFGSRRQLGVALVAACDGASCPLGWRLELPAEWDDGARRTKAHVPAGVHREPRWQLALAMLDELTSWRITPSMLYASATYGSVEAFRDGLDARDVRWLVEVDSYALTGPGDDRGARVRDVVRGAGRRDAVAIGWRDGAVHAHAHVVGRRGGARWVLAEWWRGEAEPRRYWMSNVADGSPLEALMRLMNLRRRVERDLGELRSGLGLDRFHGRSYRGWHHHTTLVSAAAACVALERARRIAERGAASSRTRSALVRVRS